jgi:hypothetical protein
MPLPDNQTHMEKGVDDLPFSLSGVWLKDQGQTPPRINGKLEVGYKMQKLISR